MMTTEEIALRLMEAQLKAGKPLGDVGIREAFAVAVTFEEQAKKVRAGRMENRKLSYDDNGL